MTQPTDRSRRKALLAGVGLAAAPVLPLAASSPSAGARVVADEFWTEKKGVRLWVYRKRLEATR